MSHSSLTWSLNVGLGKPAVVRVDGGAAGQWVAAHGSALRAVVAEQCCVLLLVDNIRTAHSRDPFEGAREVLAGLADPVHLAGCAPAVEVTAR